jgi:hypothetical protein
MQNDGSENCRQTGARAYNPAPDEWNRDEVTSEAALPKKPEPYGLTRKQDETLEKTRQSEGQNPPSMPGRPTPGPATEKTSGAGPAQAEHSKDAKSPQAGRRPGAYRED